MSTHCDLRLVGRLGGWAFSYGTRYRQQPVTQPVSVGHCEGSTPYCPQAMRPVGQVYGVPPSVDGVQSDGNVSLPMQ